MKWTLFMASISLMAGLSTASAQSDLDALRWKSRLLILFAPEPQDPRLEAQERAVLADKADLAERDLVVLSVAGGEVETLFGNPRAEHSAAALRRHFGFGPKPAFEAILIGKDGGVKWRSEAPFEMRALNAVIDAMPMRRSQR